MAGQSYCVPATEKQGEKEESVLLPFSGQTPGTAHDFGVLPFGQDLGTGSKLTHRRLENVIFILSGHVCN